MNFKLNNEAVASGTAPRWIKNAVQILTDLPDGELLSSRVLARKLNIKRDYLMHFICEFPPELTIRAQNMRIYGNAKTIAAWKKQKLHD